MDKDEEFEERTAAAAEVTARLRARRITVTGAESPEDLVNLLSAVERFEAAVEAHGGDLMVDDLKSSRPDDRTSWCRDARKAKAFGCTSAASRLPRRASGGIPEARLRNKT